MQYFELQTNAQSCPYCGETIELLIDNSIADQQYIEDCPVCCRPITVSVSCEETGTLVVHLSSENDISP